MVTYAKVTMTMRDLDRLKCIQGVIDRELKVYQAAERLGLTPRQVLRLVRRYDAEGPVGLLDRHRDRPGNRGLMAPLAERVLGILRERYADFGPTLATEKLRTRHKAVLAKEAVPQLQIASGLKIPRKLRPPNVHRAQARHTGRSRTARSLYRSTASVTHSAIRTCRSQVTCPSVDTDVYR